MLRKNSPRPQPMGWVSSEELQPVRSQASGSGLFCTFQCFTKGHELKEVTVPILPRQVSARSDWYIHWVWFVTRETWLYMEKSWKDTKGQNNPSFSRTNRKILGDQSDNWWYLNECSSVLLLSTFRPSKSRCSVTSTSPFRARRTPFYKHQWLLPPHSCISSSIGACNMKFQHKIVSDNNAHTTHKTKPLTSVLAHQ